MLSEEGRVKEDTTMTCRNCELWDIEKAKSRKIGAEDYAVSHVVGTCSA